MSGEAPIAAVGCRARAPGCSRPLDGFGVLEGWLERILPARGRVRSKNTVDNYAWAVRSHIVPALGSKSLRTLNTDDVEGMLAAMVRGGLSRNTVMRVRSVLVMALTHGERRGIVPRNVAALAEMPAEARATKIGRSLTVVQARQLLRTAQGDRIEALVVTALMLGLRPGELCGLRWEDVDLDHATLQVRRSLKRVRGELLLGEPKTRLSYRGLDLPLPVVAALTSHRSAQELERERAGDLWVDHDLVFPTIVGTAIDPSNLRRELGALSKRAGLDHWTPRELRHSAASLLSAAGVPLELVADVLGHDGTRMTAAVYRHAVKPTVSAGAVAMDQMFGAS